MTPALAQELQQIILPFCNIDLCQHIPVQIAIEQNYATAELHLGQNWKVAPLDELLVKLRDYFGKESVYIEYQVKSKAAKAAETVRTVPLAPPPTDLSMDEAMDLYQAEVSQYS